MFQPDGSVVKIRSRFAHQNGATVDSMFIWPRVATIQELILAGEKVPVSGLFADNPGFQKNKPGSPLISGLGLPPQDAPEDKPPGKQPTSIVEGTIINDETDFLTGIYCDDDNDKGTVPVRKGAETLCAIVKWGYKAKIKVGKTVEKSVGIVHPKEVTIICGPGTGQEPSEEFAAAKTTFEKAANATSVVSLTKGGRPGDWEIIE